VSWRETYCDATTFQSYVGLAMHLLLPLWLGLFYSLLFLAQNCLASIYIILLLLLFSDDNFVGFDNFLL
jgi:hypothetical protein